MNHKDAIDKLKKEVSVNPAANAVLHVFALRKRARNRITTSVLAKTMSREKFAFGINEYEAVLKTLASTGFGTLELSPKGRVRALKDIKVTLQSLGMAVCGQNPTPVKSFRPRTQFQKIAAPRVLMAEPPKAAPPAATLGLTRSPVMGIRISLVLSKGREADVTLPEDITPAEIAAFISRLQPKVAV